MALPICLAVAGCAHVDAGQIDYRVAEPPRDVTNVTLGKIDCKMIAQSSGCQPYQPARVVRRYMGAADVRARPIPAGTVYSMEIDQGVIGSNLLETHMPWGQTGKKAEFAILANVFEFAEGDQEDQTKRFLNFATQPGDLDDGDDLSDVELKLIYFSTDVKKRQPFNFSNIPLQQRSVYNGGSIGVQLVVMEVDANGPMQSLLGTLARFGQKAVPGGSEIKDMIFDLGESLFSSASKDDKLLDYRFVMSANGGVNDMRAAFIPRRYVVRRSQQRAEEMRWEDLRLDHNTGRLMRVSASGGPMEEVREELYLTLNIKTYPAGTKPESYTFEKWSGFRAELDKAADVAGASIATVTQNLTVMLAERRSDEWRAALETKWTAANAALQHFGTVAVGQIDQATLTTCDADLVALTAASDGAERDLRDAVAAFVALYRTGAAKQTGAPAVADFAVGERDAVVSRVARSFMPWNGDRTPFADHGRFEAAFVAPGNAALADRAVDFGTKRFERPTKCDALIAKGLATPNPPDVPPKQ